jgi:hypothetical protein
MAATAALGRSILALGAKIRHWNYFRHKWHSSGMVLFTPLLTTSITLLGYVT